MTHLTDLIAKLDALTVLESNELISTIEQRWGVDAQSNRNINVPQPDVPVPTTSTEFDVELTSPGAKKIQVIKVVRELTGLGLKEAKELVDAAPKVIKEGLSSTEADEVKAKLEAQGAEVALK